VGAAGASSTPPPEGERPPTSRAEARLTPLRELQLVRAHQRGDPEATRELIEAYRHRVYSVCYRMVSDRETAADLTQDTLLKVIEGLDGYQTRARLSTWIIRIAMNCCLSHLRKDRLRRHLSLERAGGADEGPGIAPILADMEELPAPRRVEQAELRTQLLQALASLDPDTRAVLMLRDMQGLEYGQIGEVLGVPVGTVKSRLFRARVALRAALEHIQGLSSAPDPTGVARGAEPPSGP
jgi:RNA polymerase sigma-70 factor (ECF subfamily)